GFGFGRSGWPAARTRPPSSFAAPHTAHSSHAAEEGLKEITECSATALLSPAEEVFNVDAALESTASSTPVGRWSEIGSVLPVGSKLIVFLTLLLVAEDLVGFLDFFEFFFCLFVVRIEVRMILAG